MNSSFKTLAGALTLALIVTACRPAEVPAVINTCSSASTSASMPKTLNEVLTGFGLNSNPLANTKDSLAVLTLANKTLNLGQALSQSVSESFDGTWNITSQPTWLTLSSYGGSCNVNFTYTVDRTALSKMAADQSTVGGPIIISWTSGSGTTAQSGTATWQIKADQYLVTGHIVDSANVAAASINTLASTLSNLDSKNQNNLSIASIVVKYKPDTLNQVSIQTVGPASLLKAAGFNQQRTQLTLAARGLIAGQVTALSDNKVLITATNAQATLEALKADPTVEYAAINPVIRLQSLTAAATLAAPLLPSDQFYPLQWPAKMLGYPAVWRDIEQGGYTKSVTVAVIDSGVRYDHPDLKTNLLGSAEGAMDFVPKEDNAKQPNGDGDGPDTDPTDVGDATRISPSHGTHVSGIIAAQWGNNGVSGDAASGIAGTSYKAKIKVLPIRVFDMYGNASASTIGQAIRYAAGLSTVVEGIIYLNPNPAKVINLSLGGEVAADQAKIMCDEVQNAVTAGSMVIVAAGNAGNSAKYYPAACAGAVSVGSVTLSGGSVPKRAPYSNYYPEVQLVAPGDADVRTEPTTYNGATLNEKPPLDQVLSTDWNYQTQQPIYSALSGTSQAAPQVAALAALMLSKGITTNAASTLERMNSTATDLGIQGRDDYFGNGLINPVAALNAPAISNTLGLGLSSTKGQILQRKMT